MIAFLLWYLIVALVGLIAFPLAYRLLPALPDRGYSFAKALGLLAWGYFFWLFASLGIVRNNLAGLLVALGIVITLSAWALRGASRDGLLTWWQEHKRLIFGLEAFFLLAFGALAIVRAANPEIQATEKPMELAFINAILHSPEFPPHDPWLAGYAISYYYFGYVLVAMLAQITAVPGGIAFNLGIALVFGLSAAGSFGLVHNLLELWQKRRDQGSDEISPAETGKSNWYYALLGPLFVLVVGNLEGLLEVLHARGIFWNQSAFGQLASTFWKWLDVKDLAQPPTQPFSFMPSRFLWWWRASRVLQDYTLAGELREVIDEFPFFSFLLADLHPHVLAIPFALLAIVLALNVYAGGGRGKLRISKYRLQLNRQSFIFAAIILGGLAFLNTWDFPIYVALFAGAYVLNRSKDGSRAWGLLREFLFLALALGIGGVVFYLPFYIGFSSQAGGVIPNLVFVTRGVHLWVMFGIFFVPVFLFLLFTWRRNWAWNRLQNGLLSSFGIALTLLVLSLWMAFAAINIPAVRDLYLGAMGASGQTGELFQAAVSRRLENPGAWVTLVLLIALSLGLLWPKSRYAERRASSDAKMREDSNPEATHDELRIANYELRDTEYAPGNSSHTFAILLILLASLLLLGPEFFYLRDQFGYRINTIFKFYYQSWILLGVAGAYATAVLLKQLRGLPSLLFDISMIALLAAGLIYPTLSLWTKTNGFSPTFGWTLDGTAYLERQSSDEVAAIRWLKTAPSGVVAEAVGGSYSEFARVATHSGHPNVLGWPGHESQWRGGAEEMGSRQSDIERLYRTSDWIEAQDILHQYDVRYVYVGSLERAAYSVNETKFQRFLQPVFQQGQVVIYEVPQMASSPLN
jgi:YYY domain-containing protein